MGMGAGGLLKEIPSRPQPRAGDAPAAKTALKVAAIVLAAGRSSRMGEANKLLADLGGEALVARTVDAALASLARPVIVVTGHEAERVRALMRGRNVTVLHNRDYTEGLSTSLRRGLAALPADADGVLVCLGDMPLVSASALDRLVAAFNPLEGRAICVPTWKGKRGNPVLFARRFLAEMSQLEGDLGARHLMGEHAELVAEVPMPDASVLIDVDTPEALAQIRRAGTVAES
jgi:molybdenum cofactor cytidylyltransferase